MFDLVEANLITCGCSKFNTDAKAYYAQNVATVGMFKGLWNVIKTGTLGYFKNIPSVTLWMFVQFLTTVSFNFYYIGYSIGNLAETFLQKA